MIEDEMQAALATLLVEASELLDGMESGLLQLEAGVSDPEIVNSIFRAAHTIKGSAGLFGLDHIVAFTHVVESVLDRLRTDQIAASPELIGVLLPCRDHIALLIGGVAAGDLAPDMSHAASGSELRDRLAPFLVAATDADHDPAAELVAVEADASSLSSDTGSMFLSVRFGPDCLRSGMDPISFIRYLGSLGHIISVTVIDELLPTAGLMDPETCYLAFAISLRTAATLAEIEAVFDFVREESDIRILTDSDNLTAVQDLVLSFGTHARRLRDVLVDSGAISSSDLSPDLEICGVRSLAPVQPKSDAATTDAAGPDVGPLVRLAAVAADVVPSGGVQADGALATPLAGAVPSEATGTQKIGRVRSEAQTIRVDASRLDRLIDTVGELIIAGAAAALGASLSGDESLRNAIGEVSRLIEGVRGDALGLRMVPIGSTFSRFQRVVHDVSAQLGKDVSLVISGGDTEVDKALAEQISDPLTHLVRNALDHGIEGPADRADRGKPARGTLKLAASHDSGTIVIEVSDDGAGLSPDRILAKAIERGLVEPTAKLDERDIYALIFEPGFSTAAQVSNLSGRGVGMDVVKRNVTALRGSIDVDSRPGAGMTVRIRLPLTLAIIDGFMVGVGATTFVIPLDRVVECVELPASTRRRNYMELRGEVLPLIELRSFAKVTAALPRRENVVVVEHEGTKTGLVVDTLRGEFQTVIKPLGPLFAHVEGVGGSTILGNGDVALIVDVPMLVRWAKNLAGHPGENVA